MFMNIRSKKWYAIHTKLGWGKKIAELLTKEAIENYYPINRVTRKWSDRTEIILEPLFTSYVFVNISEIDLEKIQNTEGVINFVYYLSKPAIIREEEIEAIKKVLANYEDVKLDKSRVNLKDHVRVTDGDYRDLEGNVLELRLNTIIVILPSLGYNLVTEIKKGQVNVFDTSDRKMAAS